MAFKIQIATGQPYSIVSARLANAVAPPQTVWPMQPVRIQAWLVRYEHASFVGNVVNGRFKLMLLRPIREAGYWRGKFVVLVGTIEDGVVSALLRPPIFNLAFAVLFTVALTIGFVLFFGPSSTGTVRLLLATMWLLPVTVLAWTFKVEAHLVEKTLRWALAAPMAVEGQLPASPRF